MDPFAGTCGYTRQRKSCASSSFVGSLKLVETQPYGFRLVKTWRTTPSLPAASNPCNTLRIECLFYAYIRYCSSSIFCSFSLILGKADLCDSYLISFVETTL